MASTLSNVITKVSADTTNFEQGMKRARKQSEQFGNTSKKVNGQMRLMRGGFGQVGHQVQDIAVQLQMGQNAMLVFGQQGSQIASLFGPGGAMIGAVVAIGAALSMSLAPAFFGATEAAKELKEANKSLIDSFDDLSPAQKAFARVLAQEKITEYTAELERLNNVSRDRLTILETGGFFDRFAAKKGELETLKDYNKRIKKLDSDTAFYKAALASLQAQVDSTTTAFTKQEASLKKQIDTFGKSAHAIRVYGIEADLAAKKIEKGEADKLIAQSRTLDTLEKNAERQKQLDADRKKAQQDAAKEADKVLKDQEKTAQRFADTIGDGFTRAITGAMSFKDAMKSVAKSVVDDLTRMIVKKMITDQIFGLITNAMGTGSAASTNTTSNLSNNSVSSITGKPFGSTVAPIQTGSANMAGGASVNQTINITTGVQQTVRAEIQNMMPQIQEATKAAVADSRARGGSYSKALVGR